MAQAALRLREFEGHQTEALRRHMQSHQRAGASPGRRRPRPGAWGGRLAVDTATVFYDDDLHEYYAADGERLKHATGMLEEAGKTDSTWMTEEGRVRGSAVHEMTMHYDLGAVEPDDIKSPYKGYLLAYVRACEILRPMWQDIETPVRHRFYRCACTPDRRGLIDGLLTTVEIKSGQPCEADKIQTALQSMMLASQGGLPAEHHRRMVIYVRADGRFKVDDLVDKRDFVNAQKVIEETCL